MPSRRTLFVLAGVLSLTFAADAATTQANCQLFPVTFANGNEGTKAVSCPAFTVPGGTLTAVSLTYLADYQFGGAATNTVQVTFVPATFSGITWTPPSTMLTVTGGQSSGAIPTGGATANGVTTAAFAAPFAVNISSAVTVGTVATSSGAVAVVYTYNPPPALTLACPPSTGTVGNPYTGSLVATGGVPAYTFSITSGSLPPVLTLNATTGAITGTPTTAGVFTFAPRVVDSVATVATTTPANCVITIADLPTLPSGSCTNAAAGIIFPAGGAAIPQNAFLVRYAANLDKGPSLVNVTNSGLNGAPLLGPGFGSTVGNLCVNVYAFSPDEQLVSCCSCLVTPNGLANFSVQTDLLQKTLTGVIPTSTVIKLVASEPGTGALAGGMLAWGITSHALPTGAFGSSETPFSPAVLSAGELASITGRCASILGNGSGFGICRSCRAGALGAGTK